MLLSSMNRLFQMITFLLLSFVSCLTVRRNGRKLGIFLLGCISVGSVDCLVQGPSSFYREPRITFQPSTRLSVPALGHIVLPGFIPLLEILVDFLDKPQTWLVILSDLMISGQSLRPMAVTNLLCLSVGGVVRLLLFLHWTTLVSPLTCPVAT